MPALHNERPDPDALLARVQREEQAALRGKLRIYFGSNAGVGKTCAMLAAAQHEVAQGGDVLAGVVETHGRAQTADMLHGLEQLPRTALLHREFALSEFDLDGALRRHPAVVLVDELAHSNAPGSRHPKRWQDVEELLSAGIDVWTTLNVQHLESLNDLVSGIIGIRVRETVPDHVFDNAHEVVVIACTVANSRSRPCGLPASGYWWGWRATQGMNAWCAKPQGWRKSSKPTGSWCMSHPPRAAAPSAISRR